MAGQETAFGRPGGSASVVRTAGVPVRASVGPVIRPEWLGPDKREVGSLSLPRPITERAALREFPRLPLGHALCIRGLVHDSGFGRMTKRQFPPRNHPPGSARSGVGESTQSLEIGFGSCPSTKKASPLTLFGAQPDGPGPSSRHARSFGSRRCETGSPCCRS